MRKELNITMKYNKYELGVELMINNATIVYKDFVIKRNLAKKAFEVKDVNKVKYFKETEDILKYIKEQE